MDVLILRLLRQPVYAMRFFTPVVAVLIGVAAIASSIFGVADGDGRLILLGIFLLISLVGWLNWSRKQYREVDGAYRAASVLLQVGRPRHLAVTFTVSRPADDQPEIWNADLRQAADGPMLLNCALRWRPRTRDGKVAGEALFPRPVMGRLISVTHDCAVYGDVGGTSPIIIMGDDFFAVSQQPAALPAAPAISADSQ